MVFLKEPIERKIHGHKMFPNGFGGFFTEGFFELFEVILSYITNTMSFMRVGGFVLSHAGMMLVVYSLMSMSSGLVGTTIIFIIGNLFVMGIEGLIVGIQVLRLEFYEMFSRYYEGNGIAFRTFS
jgi:V/A-type H+-transporting ATPase subunit I